MNRLLEKIRKNQKMVMIISIICLLVVSFAMTYAYYQRTVFGTKKQIITVGELKLELEEDENNLEITNAFPTADEVGMLQEPFTFRLINDDTGALKYNIKLTDITTAPNYIEKEITRYGLEKNGSIQYGYISDLTDSIIDSGLIAPGKTIEYTLRIWIAEEVEEDESYAYKTASYRIDLESSIEAEPVDISIVWNYTGNNTLTEFPEKDSGYYISSVECDNSNGMWNDYDWNLEVDYQGEPTTCTLTIEDGESQGTYQTEIDALEDEVLEYQNQLEDEDAAKQAIVNGINGAYPASTRVSTSSSWTDLANYIKTKMYLYKATQEGSVSHILSGSSSGSNTSASGTVTFPTAYSSTPTVTASASGAQHAQCTVSISNVTTTSFKYTVSNNAAGTGTCTVNWFSY